jgi:hypothetical protein
MISFRRVKDLLNGSFATFYRLPKQVEAAWPSSSRYRRQISDSYQIVRSGSELEDPTDQLHASMPSLAQQAHGFQPSKDLFHSFTFALTDFITRMTGGAFINGTQASRNYIAACCSLSPRIIFLQLGRWIRS